MYVVPGGAPLLLSKAFLRDLGCHIDLGRGHLYFEKLGVRAVVTGEHSAPETGSTDAESLYGTDGRKKSLR